MRIVVHGPQRRVGVLVREQVIDLAAADAVLARRPPGRGQPLLSPDLGALIEAGAAGLERVAEVVEHAEEIATEQPDAVISRQAVTLHPPTVHRPRIACAAGNYAAHTRGSQTSRVTAAVADRSDALAGLAGEKEIPTEADIADRTRSRGVPRGFWKDFSSGYGPDATIPYPVDCTLYDYEGEAAVVLGRPVSGLTPAAAAECIWGVTLFNDLSIRGKGGKGSLSFIPGKNFDGSAAMGPCILVGTLDPDDLDVEVRVNSELRQSYNTKEMIFSFAEYLAYLSRFTTLYPGDVVSGGSGSGSAIDSSVLRPGGSEWPADLDPERFLSPGDEVTVGSPLIGVLRTRIGPPRIPASSFSA